MSQIAFDQMKDYAAIEFMLEDDSTNTEILRKLRTKEEFLAQRRHSASIWMQNHDDTRKAKEKEINDLKQEHKAFLEAGEREREAALLAVERKYKAHQFAGEQKLRAIRVLEDDLDALKKEKRDSSQLRIIEDSTAENKVLSDINVSIYSFDKSSGETFF